MLRTRNKLSPELEDYLAVILRLESGEGGARSSDIASMLSVHKSTVTAALKTLAEKGLISYRAYRPVSLTERGRLVALDVTRHYASVKRFLTSVLHMREDEAGSAAGTIGHVLTADLVSRLDALATASTSQRLTTCPPCQWLCSANLHDGA